MLVDSRLYLVLEDAVEEMEVVEVEDRVLPVGGGGGRGPPQRRDNRRRY